MSNEVRTAVHNVLAYHTIDYTHWENHKGKLHNFDHYFTAIANGGSSNVIVVTNTAKEVHMIFSFATAAPSIYRVFEGCTVSADSYGTLSSSFCKNRCMTGTAGTAFYYGGSLIGGSTGTLIMNRWIVNTSGGGTGINARVSSIGQDPDVNEWILKPGTTYMYSLITQGGLSNEAVNMKFDFYEE